MGLHWEALTVDARDPAGLARWWAQALGWELGDEEPGGVEVRPPAGGARGAASWRWTPRA